MKKFSSGCMDTYDPDLSSGPFVQVGAVLISTTSRRKAGLIFSVYLWCQKFSSGTEMFSDTQLLISPSSHL